MMFIVQNLVEGFHLIASPWSMGAALIGLAAGIIVGSLPGLTATMAVAVLAPFTFFMNPGIGIPFLLAVYKGAIYGGSIPAIMINTPGTAAAAATCLDGNALARKGQPRRALQVALYSSVVADLLATIVLILVAAPLAAFALEFSSPEFTMLFLFALTMVSTVSGDSLAKGLISTAFGFVLACIGMDPMSGAHRFTFGISSLLGGISLIPFMIGLFALSEILIQGEELIKRLSEKAKPEVLGGKGKKDPKASWGDFTSVLPTVVRSSGIGMFLGSLPGLGAEISCWISYGFAKRISKKPEEYGKGSIEGLSAAEAGNNAVCPAALIPMMVFGIPGDTVTAILLGAFMAQGLMPGPLLFQQHGPILYGFFAFLLITNVLLLFLGLFAIQYLRRITLIPQGILLPAIAAVCFAGAFAVNSSYFDVILAVSGGFIGYFMRKNNIPVPPLVIAMLLAPGLENAMRQSLKFSGNNPAIFVTRPISGVIFGLFIIAIAWPMGKALWKSMRSKSTKSVQ